MSSQADAIRALNRRLLDDLDVDLAGVVEREDNARRALAAAAEARAEIERKRSLIVEVEKLQLAALEESYLGDPLTKAHRTSSRPKRARIGPQRYAILKALQVNGPLSVPEIESLTKLFSKRIRDQLRDDALDGIVTPDAGADERYSLSGQGDELLQRFEAYRQAKGIPLPSADDAQRVDDSDNQGEDDDFTEETPSGSAV